MDDLPVHHDKNSMHNISCISHRAMQLCQAVCDSVYTVRLYQARFRESLCFPALPEYLSASYFLACYCYQWFPALLIPFLMGIAMRTARTVITMSFGINAVKEYTAIAGILMEPPTNATVNHRLSQRSEVRSVRIRLRLQDSLSCSLFSDGFRRARS